MNYEEEIERHRRLINLLVDHINGKYTREEAMAAVADFVAEDEE